MPRGAAAILPPPIACVRTWRRGVCCSKTPRLARVGSGSRQEQTPSRLQALGFRLQAALTSGDRRWALGRAPRFSALGFGPVRANMLISLVVVAEFFVSVFPGLPGPPVRVRAVFHVPVAELLSARPAMPAAPARCIWPAPCSRFARYVSCAQYPWGNRGKPGLFRIGAAWVRGACQTISQPRWRN